MTQDTLFSFDSTTITLCLSLFPWANYRRAKGGVRVHVLLDHDDYMPSFVRITEAKVHDNRAAKEVSLKPGSKVPHVLGGLSQWTGDTWTSNDSTPGRSSCLLRHEDEGEHPLRRRRLDGSSPHASRISSRGKRNIVSDEGISCSGTRRQPNIRTSCGESSSRTRRRMRRSCFSRTISASARRRSPQSTRTDGRSSCSSRR